MGYNLLRKEIDFINSVVEKEMFFALASDESSDLVDLVAYYVDWEKQKLENKEIGSDDYAADIELADIVLSKLRKGKEQKGDDE